MIAARQKAIVFGDGGRIWLRTVRRTRGENESDIFGAVSQLIAVHQLIEMLPIESFHSLIFRSIAQ
jgi:hypothetical protein